MEKIQDNGFYPCRGHIICLPSFDDVRNIIVDSGYSMNSHFEHYAFGVLHPKRRATMCWDR